jgi:small subunit ribosomal protein S6
MRIYENLFIVRPDATEEEIDHLIDGISKTVTSGGGTVDKVEKWGKRRLAYRVDKHREGSYVLIQFTAAPELVREFERRLRVQDAIIKFLSVRIDETLKRVEKRRKEREKRAHRRPPAPVPQPSIAQQILGGAAEPTHPAPGQPGPGQPAAAAPAHPAPGAPAPAEAPAPTPAAAPTKQS